MLENANYEELGYESSLCKESRFKSLFGKMKPIDELSMLV